ncbi:MAG: LysM domain/BON superfamily protein [Cyanobacteria bacterium RYN_339]|nr:LysM domain/BON superfamily protein [Cyanobacteria bacterium RYN_339]
MAMRITGPAPLPPRQTPTVVAAPPVERQIYVRPPQGPDPIDWMAAKAAAAWAWLTHFFKHETCLPPVVVPRNQDDPSPGAVPPAGEEPDPVGGDDPLPQPVVAPATPVAEEPVSAEPVADEPVAVEPITVEPEQPVEPVAQPAPAPLCPIYRVKTGDSLRAIACAKLGDEQRWPEIYALNRRTIGGNPDLIFPGQMLRLPPG